MIVNLDTVRYFWEVYEGNEYSFVFDKLRVIDLGCSAGEFSLWIYPRCERIWAIDSNENCINNFEKTIKDNNLQNISTYIDKVVDLTDFVNGHAIKNIDILKIDIEGGEYEIFRKDIPHIPTIIGEYHGDSLEPLLIEKGYRYIELPNKHFIARL